MFMGAKRPRIKGRHKLNVAAFLFFFEVVPEDVALNLF